MARASTSSSAEGPIEKLLEHTLSILELQAAVRTRKIQLRSIYISASVTILLALGVFISTVATWQIIDLRKVNQIAVPITILSGILCGVLLNLEYEREDTKSVRKLEVELEMAEERKRLQASQMGIPVFQRQFTYKDSIPDELQSLRDESQHYRRIHNLFQSLIIIGSLGTTTAASLAETPSYLKWVTVGLSFTVGVSAGFTGYFKYRERSFYLQQTADAIEQHVTAHELGISPYIESETENLARLAKEVESLRVEQRKRQQQLDQPHEGRDGTV
ncbi:DUF4231 domain-containing protein [Streptomyces sp. AA1529]|uniref:DUF4231 domain-containing protein n=1 Tax=Streptomyces sp. AA1529 TaxID=1203257 RepID=UPI003D7666B2